MVQTVQTMQSGITRPTLEITTPAVNNPGVTVELVPACGGREPSNLESQTARLYEH